MSDVRLYLGDCLDVMAAMEPNSIDSIVTDPPYGLSFMGKEWDHGVPGIPFWQAALRVAKPGAILLAFGGTRTFHRLTCAIEDAGWEIRDCLMWLYASGFPKGHDISKAIDKASGAEREVIGRRTNGHRSGGAKTYDDDAFVWPQEFSVTAPATEDARAWSGWNVALKPAWEPIILAMKPLDGTFAHNALTHGIAGLNIDGCRIPANGDTSNDRKHKDGKTIGGTNALRGGWHDIGAGYTAAAGRWPANLLLDEEAAELLDAASGNVGGRWGKHNGQHPDSMFWGTGASRTDDIQSSSERFIGDTGGASRFFYVAKPSRRERNAGLDGMPEKIRKLGGHENNEQDFMTRKLGSNIPAANHHPTVKPITLLRYLCRLTRTPTGGIVLDPFMGSGSTGYAAVLEGRSFIGIEIDAAYLEIARHRIEYAQRQPSLGLEDERDPL